MAAKKNIKSKNNKTKKDDLKPSSAIKKKDLIELQVSLDEEKNKFLRLFAEFENYKKRTAKERIELFKTASQELMVALLPILDDFERALSEHENKDEKLTGIVLIYNKMFDTLKQQGLTKMEIENKALFDAEIHEAITQLPASNKNPKGTIVDVVAAGYKLGDKIIRYPKVVVAQ